MSKPKVIDFSRCHSHVVHDLSTGYVSFTLPYDEVKDLYFACLVNQSRAASLAKVANLLKSILKY